MNGETPTDSIPEETALPEPELPPLESEESAPPSMPLAEVQAGVEALLYASGDPLSARDLKKVFPEAGDLIRPALDRLKEIYGESERGLQLTEIAGGFQITTRPEYHEVLSRLFETSKPSRLSLQALETLAVIAYRQPATVPEIMELRGVRSASVVRTLLEKKLIKIVGRKNIVGRPLLYGTTKEFLLRFGLKDVKDLPQLKDMSEVFGDEVAQQLEALDGLPAPDAVVVVDAGDVSDLEDEEGSAEPEDGIAAADQPEDDSEARAE